MKAIYFLVFYFAVLLTWASCKKKPDDSPNSSGSNAQVTTLSQTIGDVAPFPSAPVKIKGPTAIAVYNDTLFVCNTLGNSVIKISPDGTLSAFAGNGDPGNIPLAGDGEVQASDASFTLPQGIAADKGGNIYVSDFGNSCIRQITPAGMVSTYAGIPGQAERPQQDGVGAKLQNPLYFPLGLTINNSAGSPILFVVENPFSGVGTYVNVSYGRIKRIGSGPNGAISNYATVAPSNVNSPVELYGICLNPLDNKLYATRRSQNTLISSSSTVNTNPSTFAAFAGQTSAGYVNGLVTRFSSPSGVVCDPQGNLYVADSRNNAIRKVLTAVGPNQKSATTFAGNTVAAPGDFINSDNPLQARFKDPRGLAFDSKGNLFVSDYVNNAIRKITPGGKVTTLAETPLPETTAPIATGSAFSWSSPGGITQDQAGNFYVTDQLANSVRKIDTKGVVTTIGGPLTGNQAGSEDAPTGPGYLARFNTPTDLVSDPSGNIYVADAGNNCIRRIEAGSNIVSTFVGNSQSGGGFKDGTGDQVLFNNPRGIAIDAKGDLYVSDAGNFKIRKIFTHGADSTKVITYAGSTQGYLNSLTPGSARFGGSLRGLTVDKTGVLFVCDAENNVIREISPSGTISTAAGLKAPGFKDGPGIQAQFNSPLGVAADDKGNLYVTDAVNHRIRKIDPKRNVTTLLGFRAGFSDGGASDAQFDFPKGIVYISASNSLLVTDQDNKKIRKIQLK